MYKKIIKNKSLTKINYYKKYKNILTSLLRLSEKLYYSNKINNNKNNIKYTWSIINNLINPNLGKKGNNSNSPNANEFNTFFSNIGINLSEKISAPSLDNDIYKTMQGNNKNSLFFTQISIYEILNEVRNSKSKSSTDVTDFSMFIIKEIILEISPLLKHVFNRSLAEGIFPNVLKKAKVIPIFKSGDKSLAENYRPISLLPQISKIFEKLIKSRISNFLNKFNILNDNQYGFRKNLSTADALSDVLESVNTNLENLENCAIVSIDLCKAFDTLDHDILINKLYIYGIRGIALKLIKSYLSDRIQFVRYNNTDSYYNYIKCGVPQGSVLGPLLFILYINDLPNISDTFKSVLFADDTTLIFSNTSILELKNNIQFNINKLYDWLNVNKLSLNISKTNVLLFNIRNKNININMDLNINNIKVKQVSEIKFVGVIIDCKLNWKLQLNYVSSKLSRTIEILHKVKNKLNMKSLILLYNALFLSHLNYCSNIWGNTFKSSLKNIFILQKRAIKCICNTHSMYTNFYTISNSLKFDDIIKMNSIKFMFRARNNILPKNLQLLYKAKSYNGNLFHRIKVRTDRKAFCLSNTGPMLWNRLPQKIRNITKLNNFKTIFKSFMISSY